jgi:glucoselysine-6-phosphate deglycase
MLTNAAEGKMIETMHDCYLSQFNCLANLLAQRTEITSEFVNFYKSIKPDRIYLIGSGTSFNACAVASGFMENALGVEVTVAAPTSVGRIRGKRPLAVAVSQSGRSTNTINAIKKLREAGAAVVTLTDPTDTPVGKAGDLPVRLAADNELIGPRTRGYSATILTLYLLSLEAGLACGSIGESHYNKAIAAFEDTFAKGGLYYKACQDFYDLRFDELSKARKYVFTGKGAAAKTGGECALKVLETLCYPAFGYEYEEFLHGPVCFSDEELALFIFLSYDTDKKRMLQTADIIDKITKNCYIVTHCDDLKRDNVLVLPSDFPEYSSAFTNVMFGQLISAKLTGDLARARHPGVKEIFSGMDTKIIDNTPAKTIS